MSVYPPANGRGSPNCGTLWRWCRYSRKNRASIIMAFEHVRIALANRLDELLENLALCAREFVLPATIVAKLNGLQGVVGNGNYGHLHSVELIEAHSLERRAPGRRQILLHGVVHR